MSHFTEVKTKLKNEERIKKVLKNLGFEVVSEEEGLEQGVNVRGYFGETTQADFKILTKSKYDIGFVQSNDGSYEITGDWELLPKVSNIEQDLFTNKISQEYAHETIKELAEEKGYSIDYVESEEDGTIEMVVTQW
jgi:hypothetical protein